MREEANRRVSAGAVAIKSIDQEIAELVGIIREQQARLEQVEAEVLPVIEAAKERLKMLLEYRGENWADDVGYARLFAGGVRRIYDADALDRLIMENPKKYGWLTRYRREVPFSGGVRVK